MPVNVEIKARVRDYAALLARAQELADGPPVLMIRQEDTFFRVPAGRLKLRVIDGGRGELIVYRRADEAGPKASEYDIAPVADPARLRAVLAAALGEVGVVRKERTLCLVGQTRVHLDRVEGLGDYMELEVVLRTGQSVEDGRRVADELMRQLGVNAADLVTGAYTDLLAGR